MSVLRHRMERSRRPPPDPIGFLPWRPRGPRGAAIAGLVLLPVMTVGGTWALVHAASTGEIPERHGWVRQADDPLGFWIHVAMYAVTVPLLYGVVGMVIYGFATRRRSERKLDAYLQRRADEGSRASAMPPRLR